MATTKFIGWFVFVVYSNLVLFCIFLNFSSSAAVSLENECNFNDDNDEERKRKTSLLIIISTIGRRNLNMEEAYLLQTLRVLRKEFNQAERFSTTTKVLIVHNTESLDDSYLLQHEAFVHAKNVEFFNDTRFIFKIINVPPLVKQSYQFVNYRVQKQTRDIVSTFEYAIKFASSSSFDGFLIMEDDFLMCDGGIQKIHSFLTQKEYFGKSWMAIRVSFGFNGVVLKTTNDLNHLKDYLFQHSARRPPDHLLVEWFTGETNQAKLHLQQKHSLTYKHNLMEHIGIVSTVRLQPNSGDYLKCFEILTTPTLFSVEAYNFCGFDLCVCGV